MTAVYVLALAAAWFALLLYTTPQRISPDGRFYLDAAQGKSVPRPFHLRPLLPWVCGESVVRWRIATWVGLASTAVLVASIADAHGLDRGRAILASALFLGLPMVRNTAERPVLVDAPAMALAALSALLSMTGHGVAAAAVACIGASAKEHVPVFAAAAAWSLWPLVGLAVPVALALTRTPAPPVHASQQDPIRYARIRQAPRLHDPLYMVMPWGICLAALLALSPAVVVSLALGYGVLFVASDSTRVYQWAAVPVCVAAASVVPGGWLVPAAVAHLWWPWRGEV